MIRSIEAIFVADDSQHIQGKQAGMHASIQAAYDSSISDHRDRADYTVYFHACLGVRKHVRTVHVACVRPIELAASMPLPAYMSTPDRKCVCVRSEF